MAEGMLMVGMLWKEDWMSLYEGRNMVSAVLEMLLMAVHGKYVVVGLASVVRNACGNNNNNKSTYIAPYIRRAHRRITIKNTKTD